MTEFKVGDEVWFFWTNLDTDFWGDDENSIFPKNVEIAKGKIVYFSYEKDSIHVYVDDAIDVCRFGACFHELYFFKSKQQAIDAMIKRLEELRQE